MPEIEDGDLVLVRGSPFGADRLMEQAVDEHVEQAERGAASPRYAVSVFGALKTPEVSADKLIEDILTKARITGRTVSVVTDRVLQQSGFSVEPSEPPENHYDLVLGDPLTSEAAKRLAGLFGQGRRRNPLWRR